MAVFDVVVVSDELLVELLDDPVRRIDGTATAVATSAARMMAKMIMQQMTVAALPRSLVTPPPPAAGAGMTTLYTTFNDMIYDMMDYINVRPIADE